MNQRRKSTIFGAALAALSASCMYAPSAQAVEYLWARAPGSSSNWSNSNNSGVWLNDLPVFADPTSGVTQDIVFSTTLANNQSNQIGTAYTINSLTILDGFGGTTSIPTSGATNPQLTLAGPVIANNSTVNTSIGNYTGSSASFNILLGGQDITVDTNMPNTGASGTHYLYLDNPIAGPGAIVKTGQGLLILDKYSSTWTGDSNGVTLYLNQGAIRTGGTVNDANPYQFGTGIVDNESNNDVNISASSVSNEGGGSLRTFANGFKLGGTGQISFGGSFGFDFTSASSWTLTSQKLMSFTFASEMDGVISSSGGFGFTKSGGGSFMLTNANTYAGPTIANSDIALNGANASSANSALTINSSGSVEFEYVNPLVSTTTLNLSPVLNKTRFASVTMNGGSLTDVGTSSGNSSDVVTGAVTFGSGQSTITANAASGTNTTILFGSSASTGGTVLFRGSSLGGQEVGFGSGTSNIIFQTAPSLSGGKGSLSSTSTPIITWAVGDSSPTGLGTDFVTYGANGVQLLTTYADQSTLNGANGADNFKLTGLATLTTNAAINSLILATGGSVEGSSNLSVQSGAILATDNSDIGGTTPGSLNFGNSPGIITVDATKTLTIGSPVANVNNVTKSGTGTLVLTANNTGLIGSVTLDSGVLNFASNSLGTASIIFNGGTLQWATGNTADVSAKIAPLTSTAQIDTNGNNVTFASPISAAAGNITAGLNKNTGAGMLTLSAANNYQGPTTVSAGNIQLNNVNAVGNSTLTINVDNGVTFGLGIGAFNLGGLAGANVLALQNVASTPISLTIGSNNLTTTFSGAISGPGSIFKVGTGTLILNNFNSNSYSGGTTLQSGTLAFSNDNLGSGPITFTGNATLQWYAQAAPSIANSTQDISGQLQPIPSGVTASLDPQGGNVTLSNGISGGGAINKLNTGALILAGTNTYGGGTTISAGYLQIGNGGTSGSITGNVSNNGTLTFDRTDNVMFTGAITGSGSVRNYIGSGTLTLSNAGNSFGGYLQPDAPITVSANMTVGQISGASTLNITAGKLTVSAQSLLNNVNDLNISGSAQLDLTDNSLYIHDTTQLSSIVGLLTTGFNNGTWNGPGIMTSRSAAHNYYTTLGYGVVNLGTTASPDNVIYIKYTLPGDTNLDGTVNNTDLTKIVPATSGATWGTGDFNYDGMVNADDYALFQLGAALGSINPSLAPEPGALAFGALAVPMFIRRRKS